MPLHSIDKPLRYNELYKNIKLEIQYTQIEKQHL